MPLLKLIDAANELNVSERTVQRLVKRGQIRYVRIGKLIRFDSEELCRFKNAATFGGCDSSITGNLSRSQQEKVLPMSRQKCSKHKLDRILSKAA